jgi:hypothetical protein
MRLIVSIFLLLLFIPVALHAEQTKKTECMYTPKATKENPSPELTSFKDCGTIDSNGKFVIDKKHLGNILFAKDEPACVYASGPKVFYVLPDGKSIEAQMYDNGCDYFSEGVARGAFKGKKVYFNKKLEIVIETPYETIFPFESGYAAVCNGVREEKADEHTGIKGGQCGYIDHTGKVIVPLKYAFENLPPAP